MAARKDKAGLGKPAALISAAHRENIPLPERVNFLIELLAQPLNAMQAESIYMLMYDIENNSVRRLVAKYLERLGFIRIQKSVYFARLSEVSRRNVVETLREINEVYENNDSIVLLPLTAEQLKNGHLLGKELHINMLIHKPRVVFF